MINSRLLVSVIRCKEQPVALVRYATNRELASSPAQNEAFTRTVDAAEALSLGKGQQLTGTLRCLSL